MSRWTGAIIIRPPVFVNAETREAFCPDCLDHSFRTDREWPHWLSFRSTHPKGRRRAKTDPDRRSGHTIRYPRSRDGFRAPALRGQQRNRRSTLIRAHSPPSTPPKEERISALSSRVPNAMNPRPAESGKQRRAGSGTPSGPPEERGECDPRLHCGATHPRRGGGAPEAPRGDPGRPRSARGDDGQPGRPRARDGRGRLRTDVGDPEAGTDRADARQRGPGVSRPCFRERQWTAAGAGNAKRPGDQCSCWSPGRFPSVAGQGFEPWKAKPTDLQSAPIGRSGNLPGLRRRVRRGASPRIADDPPEPEIGCSGAPRPGTSGARPARG